MCLQNYVPSSQFVVSVVSAVPFDRIITSPIAPYLRMLKCLRVERIASVMPFMEAVVQRGTVIIPALKPISELLMTFFVAVALCHVMSCVLYWAGHPMWEVLEGDGSGAYVCESEGTCGWVLATFRSDQDQMDRYYTAFYYSFTIMSTVGFGDMSAHNTFERLLTTLIMFIGVAMYGVLLGSITSLIQKEDLGTGEFEEKMAQMVVRTQAILLGPIKRRDVFLKDCF